jgi:hypothetical protein
VRDERVKSELLEFSAISMAGLGYSREEVRLRFREAIEACSGNERARYNLQLFEARMDEIERQGRVAERCQFNWRRIPEEYFETVERKERETVKVYQFN